MTEPAHALRREAHRALGRLIRTMEGIDRVPADAARGMAYRWLSEEMNIPSHRCRIKDLTLEDVGRLIGLCRTRVEKITGEVTHESL